MNSTFIDKILAGTILKVVPQMVRPNHLTLARFISIPFVLYLLIIQQYHAGVILFLISAFTDALDGAMARTRNQITEWGKICDPIADKLLIGLVAAWLIPHYLSIWIVVAFIVIEVVLVGTAWYLRQHGGVDIKPNVWGKMKMIGQTTGIGLLFIYAVAEYQAFLQIAAIAFYLAIILGILSLLAYGKRVNLLNLA